MGLFWDLIQQSQISQQRDQAASLENRVEGLERELAATKEVLKKLIATLEEHFGQDIDRDGRIGR